MRKNHARRGINYEKRKAKQHGGMHIGGPGNPDYIRGRIPGEVKNRNTPITKPELMLLCQKGVREVDSRAGYTQPAIDYRDRYCSRLKLMKKGKVI